MAGSVHPGVMPIKHMLSMAGQTDVGMEKEELGLMTFTGFQEGASSVLLPATAVYSRSGMAGAYTGHVQLVEVD